MQLEDLLATDDGRQKSSIDRQGGRISLDKDAISNAGVSYFQSLSSQLYTHGFWTAAVSQSPIYLVEAYGRRSVAL